MYFEFQVQASLERLIIYNLLSIKSDIYNLINSKGDIRKNKYIRENINLRLSVNIDEKVLN